MWANLRSWAALNPLVRLAIAAVLGIAVADQWIGVENVTSFLVLGILACGLALARPRWVPLELPAFLVFAFVQQVRLSETTANPVRLSLTKSERIEVTARGYLMPVPFNANSSEGGAQQLRLEAYAVDFPQQGRRLTGTVSLRGWMTSRRPLPPAGEYEVMGRLRLPRGPTNPGQFDSAAYALRQGIVAELDVTGFKLLNHDSLPLNTWFLHAAERCRDWIGQQLEAGIEGEDDAVALIRGMALGATDETSSDLEKPFRDTGTLHVFSVSGLHVALITTIGWLFLSAIGCRRSLALIILIPGVFAYAFITGWRPSAARAAIMVAVFMAAVFFDRKSRLQNSLGGAALILLAWEPQHLFMAGFQLSFGVLWAIAIIATPLSTLLRPWTDLDPFLPAQAANWRQRFASMAKTWLVASLTVSLAAWLGSLPLMLWHFHVATPISVLANCLLVPLAFAVLAAACVSLVFAVLHLGVFQILVNNACWLFAKMMLWGAVLFAKVPGGCFTWHPAWSTEPPAALEMTVAHLPYGEASVLLHAGQAAWLLDTGGKRSFSNIVQPLLLEKRTDALAGLILSHSDIEHVGGCTRAYRDHGRPLVGISSLEPWLHETSLSSLKRFMSAQNLRSGSTLRQFSEGDRLHFGSDAAALVLHPSRFDLHDKSDDRALVLLCELGGFRVLWLNDSGFITEKTLMERHLLKALRCDVLIRNQHASDFSALPDFLLAARPRIIITSNVPYIQGEAMSPTLAVYAERHQAHLFDQNVHGAITIRIEKGILEAVSFVTGESARITKRR